TESVAHAVPTRSVGTRNARLNGGTSLDRSTPFVRFSTLLLPTSAPGTGCPSEEVNGMIICRTPFRISFFGGGTDYPSWYRQHGGAVLAASIGKYCYLTFHHLPPFL